MFFGNKPKSLVEFKSLGAGERSYESENTWARYHKIFKNIRVEFKTFQKFVGGKAHSGLSLLQATFRLVPTSIFAQFTESRQ